METARSRLFLTSWLPAAAAAKTTMSDCCYTVVVVVDGGYFGGRFSGRRKTANMLTATPTNLIYCDRYAPSTTTGHRHQTLLTVDIFQTSSAGVFYWIIDYVRYADAVPSSECDGEWRFGVFIMSWVAPRRCCLSIVLSLSSDGNFTVPRDFHCIFDSCRQLTMTKRVVHLIRGGRLYSDALNSLFSLWIFAKQEAHLAQR